MNIFLILSGVFATFTMIGHFAVGQKQFLAPTLAADFDPIAKKVMHSVFHYVSVFLILSTLGLLSSAFGYLTVESAKAISLFIGANYLFFAIWQIVIALGSGIEKPLIKLFQWVFFVLIGVFAVLGGITL